MKKLSSHVTLHKTTIPLVQGGDNIPVSKSQSLNWISPVASCEPPVTSSPSDTAYCTLSPSDWWLWPHCKIPSYSLAHPLHYTSLLPQTSSTCASQAPQCSWPSLFPSPPVQPPWSWSLCRRSLPFLPTQTALTTSPSSCTTSPAPAAATLWLLLYGGGARDCDGVGSLQHQAGMLHLHPGIGVLLPWKNVCRRHCKCTQDQILVY